MKVLLINGSPRGKGITDDVHLGQQHGMDAEKPESRRAADAGKGAGNHDELYPITS